jgi:uncharacterized protein YacL
VTTLAFRRGVRAAVAIFAALFVASAAGWVPVFPVVAGAIVTLLLFSAETWIALAGRETGAPRRAAREALVDTSALIDGRLKDVAASGFVQLDLIVPEFVLRELQHVADSPDPSRRARGRRGLDVLSAMRAAERVPIRVIADDAPEEAAVDLKLVALAVRRGAVLVTTDFALNKIAAIHGVAVLNVNELAHALRPAVLPGERLRVAIVKDGKEPGQGVAYLDDGTMIVVEQGRGMTGRTIDVVVTSAIQTAAGKMFFARVDS